METCYKNFACTDSRPNNCLFFFLAAVNKTSKLRPEHVKVGGYDQ